MEQVGITFTEQQLEQIEKLKTGMAPIEDPEGRSTVRNRSEVVRILVELGLEALVGMDEYSFELSPEVAKRQVRHGVRSWMDNQLEEDRERHPDEYR